MLERIDPKLVRSGEALPVAGGGGREPEREVPQRAWRSGRHIHDDDGPDGPERADEMLARLAAATADIRRVSGEGGRAPAGVAPDPSVVAAQIARDGAGALAAQAVLGPAGVRLVLDRGEQDPAGIADAPK